MNSKKALQTKYQFLESNMRVKQENKQEIVAATQSIDTDEKANAMSMLQ